MHGLSCRQDACVRLLLLVAKTQLSPAQREDSRKLAGQVADWAEFTQIAADKFIAPLAYRHLGDCASDIVPKSAMEALAQRARLSVIATLRVVAAHIAFHKTCIAPTGARHAYLKGVALGQLYYPQTSERFCRDIDVLVADEDVSRVVATARAAGYRILVTELAPPLFVEEQNDVAFLSRHSDVVTLIGPDGVAIEVHRKLDKLSVDFNLRSALKRAISVQIADVEVQVLDPVSHFAYICYHHSRHFWSHLHWLADLDAMAHATDFDAGAVLALADDVGIRPTIEAAFTLNQLVSQRGLWGDSIPVQTTGGQFLEACLVNLEGGLDLEEKLRGSMMYQDFMSPWQVDRKKRLQFWARSWLRRLRPSETQYFARRYPRALHWLYTLENTLQLAKNGLALALSPSPKPGSPRPRVTP